MVISRYNRFFALLDFIITVQSVIHGAAVKCFLHLFLLKRKIENNQDSSNTNTGEAEHNE